MNYSTRTEQAKQLVRFALNDSSGLGWQPTIHGRGVTIYPNTDTRLTAPRLAAEARAAWLFGRDTVPMACAVTDAILILHGIAEMAVAA